MDSKRYYVMNFAKYLLLSKSRVKHTLQSKALPEPPTSMKNDIKHICM